MFEDEAEEKRWIDKATAAILRKHSEREKGREMNGVHEVLNMAAESTEGTANFENPAGSNAGHVRIKGFDERFSTKRYQRKHPKTGEPLYHRGQPVEHLSEYQCAR